MYPVHVMIDSIMITYLIIAYDLTFFCFIFLPQNGQLLVDAAYNNNTEKVRLLLDGGANASTTTWVNQPT